MVKTITNVRKTNWLQHTLLLAFLFSLFSQPLLAQEEGPVTKVWDKTFGGSGPDMLYSVIETPDGGYLLGGHSYTGAEGDKTEESKGSRDYWIVKINQEGDIVWDKTIGGALSDELTIIINTPDGGYLLGGSSNSYASGDKTENSKSMDYYYNDYWVVKLNADGSIAWEKTVGGNLDDRLTSLVAAPDGGYLLGGSTGRPITGQMDDYTAGQDDFLVAKLNSDGSIAWEKTIGGDRDDELKSMVVAVDGGYLLGGYSNSPFKSGVKTKSAIDESLDYWVVKLDTDGNQVWDRIYGGMGNDYLTALTATPDGGYLLGGRSNSDDYEDKSQDSKGGEDYWVVKINSAGSKVWDKTYGGNNKDTFTSLTVAPDGGYLLGGFTTSPAGGDKSEASNRQDYWIVKLNTNGSKAWDKTFGGDGDDQLQSLTATTDGGYLLGGLTLSGASGDKTEESKGSFDYWVVKINEATEETATRWTGAASNDWNDPANWTLGVPNAETDAVIGYNTSGYPVLNNGTYTALNLTINEGAMLTLAIGGTLNVIQSFINNGTFIDEGGTINPGSIGGGSMTTLQNFTVSPSGTTLAGDVAIEGILTLQGNLNTNNKTLMLRSDEFGTAYVNNEGGEVIGEASMERYIDGDFNVGPGYRHFSSPVVNTTLQDMVTENYTPVVNPAYNTAANPYAVTPFPNIFGFDESRITGANETTSSFDYGWYSSEAMSSVLEPGKGYSVNIPSTAKVTLSGTLNNGDITVTGLGNGRVGSASGWHLLGNPYPSPIDWTLLSRPSGIDDAIYVYRSSGQYAGTYAAYVNGIGDEDARYIAPMQGFFIHNSMAKKSASLTFTNDARVYDKDPVLYRTTEQRPQLQLKLIGKGGLADETYVYFQEGATTAVNGQFDAYKVLTYNTDRPTLFARLGQDAVSIKGLPLDNASHSIPLEFYVTEAGSYTFSVAKLVNFPAVAQVKLLDRETNGSHDLSQGKEITLALSTTTDPHRFVLSFAAVAGSPLSIEELAAAGVEAIVYPNPSHGDVNLVLSGLQASSEKVELELYNILGQQVLRLQVSASEVQAGVKLSTAGFAKGIYHLHIQTAGSIIKQKLVLSK